MAPKAKSTRKLSPYNKFVRKYFKDNPGTTMSKAAKSWNRGKPKKTKAITRTRTRNVRKTTKRKNGISFTSGMKAQGLLLDAGWGLAGLTLLGKNNPGALPVTRIIQGLAANTVFPNMGGKRRLIYGILDYLDLWLAGGSGFQGGNGTQASLHQIVAPLRNLAKITPL